MKHSINLVNKFNKLFPRREYIYRWERGQWYDGYDEHWDSNQRLKYSRIYKINHRNRKNKKYKGGIMDKKYLKDVLDVLKEVEFSGDYEEPDYDWEESLIEGQHYSCCPICGIYIGEEHYEDCKLYNLIKHTEKMLNEL